MSGFTGSYLRVLTPLTIDGLNLKYIDGQVAYKESHVANTKVARTAFEKLNLKRPAQLKHIIEVVGDEPVKPRPKPNPEAQVLVSNEPVVATKNKPGPRPRAQAIEQ